MQEIQVKFLGQEGPLDEGNDNPLKYSCLGNPTDRGAWQAIACSAGLGKAEDEALTRSYPGFVWADVYITACGGAEA